MFQVGVDTSSAQVNSAEISSAQFSSRISAKQNESCFVQRGEEIRKMIAIGYRVSCGTMTADDECSQSLWLRLVKQYKPSLYKDAST